MDEDRAFYRFFGIGLAVLAGGCFGLIALQMVLKATTGCTG